MTRPDMHVGPFGGLVSRKRLITDPASPFVGLSERTILRFEAAGMPVIRCGRKVRLYDVTAVRRWLTSEEVAPSA
jgi:hypothetical protein